MSVSALGASGGGGGGGMVTIEPSRAPHPRPFNPFLDSGALAVASLIGRGHYPASERLYHDNGTRFSHMMNELQRWCGGRKVGFNNSVFLAQKQKRLKTLAISHYLKGMSVYPAVTDPTETAHYLFQAEAIEAPTCNLSIIAATLANIGCCPLTQDTCLAPDVMRSVLSLMYNSGMNHFTGRWLFSVGIPAACGLSGITLAVVPGVMGMVIYSPRVNAAHVSPRALAFCELLTARYRVNLFDQLVYADDSISAADAAPSAGRVGPTAADVRALVRGTVNAWACARARVRVCVCARAQARQLSVSAVA